jgi:hypothetical protein
LRLSNFTVSLCFTKSLNEIFPLAATIENDGEYFILSDSLFMLYVSLIQPEIIRTNINIKSRECLLVIMKLFVPDIQFIIIQEVIITTNNKVEITFFRKFPD